MLNDVIFNDDKSAYEDYSLVLVDKEIGLPEPKLSTVDIFGADGVLDVSLDTDIKYKNRAIKLTFELMDGEDYYTHMSNICNYLHGKIVTMSFSNDDKYYYKGRVKINPWQCSAVKRTIVINLDAEPYKLEKVETIISLKLDNHAQNITLNNLRKTICPTIEVSGVNMSITSSEGVVTQLKNGLYQTPSVILYEGNNSFTLNGYGDISFRYRRGSL